jgi:UDP-N-acetylmuramoylalanine--D-glutamate ligase
MNLAGQRVLVVGLARTGVAAARFCAERGARVTASDHRPRAALAESLASLEGLPIAYELGGHEATTFTAQDLVVLSPGVPPTIPALRAARAAGVPVLSEIELAARFLEAPLVAITGTNGKTTTTALVGDVLRRAGRRTFVGGNIGNPLLEAVGGAWDVVVVEVSSFQLEAVSSFAPQVGVVLNVTPDHLDRYDSMDDYAAAKERLFAAQRRDGHAVLNADDPVTRAMAERVRGSAWLFSARRPVERGGFIDGDTMVLRLGGMEERIDARGRKLLGRHNLENLLVMALCARLLGAPGEAIAGTLSAFEGLPHRLELVRTHRGVRYYNDSKATNVESLEKSLAAVPGPIRLIAGGRHKGASYRPLAPLVREKVRSLYLIGEAAGLIAADLGDAAPVLRCGDLPSAVRHASRDAREGEAVLLSPACASYDQFRDYEERGDTFRRLVGELP